ncbi:Uncharacterized protein Fot_02241 [Forsythia ovata]|uniref:Uncharacterized protein n=1 Tax=Forsythia ovata TaxID=205694 RepID=A0ABD1X6A3_9LAMI
MAATAIVFFRAGDLRLFVIVRQAQYRYPRGDPSLNNEIASTTVMINMVIIPRNTRSFWESEGWQSKMDSGFEKAGPVLQASARVDYWRDQTGTVPEIWENSERTAEFAMADC